MEWAPSYDPVRSSRSAALVPRPISTSLLYNSVLLLHWCELAIDPRGELVFRYPRNHDQWNSALPFGMHTPSKPRRPPLHARHHAASLCDRGNVSSDGSPATWNYWLGLTTSCCWSPVSRHKVVGFHRNVGASSPPSSLSLVDGNNSRSRCPCCELPLHDACSPRGMASSQYAFRWRRPSGPGFPLRI